MTEASDRIKLQRYKESAHLHSPLKNFDIDTHEIEIRLDPLTGKKSIVGFRLVEKYDTLIESTDDSFIESLVQESYEKCFFCPDKVRSATPKFLQDILPEGRISVGETVLFPNLFPLSKYHAIIVPCEKHFLKPDEFSSELLGNTFLVAKEFISALPTNENLYGSINSNYMMPAGASAIHPHLQVIVTSQQLNYSKAISDAITNYREMHGHDYWEDIIEVEMKLGERYIGKIGSIHWITPFSPSCTNEVWGILPIGRFIDLSKNDIKSLGEGVSKVLRYYGTNGFSSFNLSLDLGLLSARNQTNRCFIRLVTRQNVSPGYRAGEHFFQHLLGTEVVVIPPEIVAEKLRSVFAGV